MSAKKVIEWEQECRSCGGTGIYRGLAEGNGFGVVCSICNGTGRQEMRFEYAPFRGRRKVADIVQVIQKNPGIGIGCSKEKGFDFESFGGIPYKDWWDGKKFKHGTEMRNFVCPMWWYQSVDVDKKPNWKVCGNSWGKSFESCSRFKCKDECWARYDKEMETKSKKKSK